MSKSCYYCVQKKEIDFQDIKVLRKWLSFDDKIEPRKKTGLCASHQRKATRAIKTARQMGMLK
ncbi:MAG: 30S ribosomal protein S18 [Patescibacteria group bacterium]|jgi:small subunit ribosomal protein S18|nr:30S ribosomal protein S18 [Patescibacteria group bacterium]